MPAITRSELQSYACQTCMAKPGDPCRTRLTSVPTEPHKARWTATFAGRAQPGARESVAQVVQKLYGEPEREVRFHFIYNARKHYDANDVRRDMWCACRAHFGDDLEEAQKHLRAAHRIPEWLADVGIRSDVEHYVYQQVIDGMLANDEDPTDRELFVRYRDWLLGGLGQQWIDKLDEGDHA